MSKPLVKPQEVQLFTRNMIEFYEDMERLILTGYTVVKEGYASPASINGFMQATLVLKATV